MEKRLLLAVVLMTAAILFTNLVFPPPEPAVVEETPIGASGETAASTTTPVVLPALPAAAGQETADTITVESGLYRYRFSSVGASLVGAELLTFSSYAVEGEPVQLVPDGAADLFTQRLLVGGDTVDLRVLPFTPSADRLVVGAEGATLDFTYADSAGFSATIRYEFDPDAFLVRVSGAVDGVAGQDAVLLSSLGPGLGVHEHPDHRSEREFAVVTRSPEGIDRLAFRRVEGLQSLGSGLSWAAIKDKYFLAAVVADDSAPFSGGVVADVPDAYREIEDDSGDAPDGVRDAGDEEVALPQAIVTTALPLNQEGGFSYQAYFGPQDYGRLSAIGSDLQEVTPYGYRWLQPVIRPLAAAVLWVLNTLHDTLGIAYGWVLVIFGVMMRIVLWPLNAKAMRAQMKNMGVQPLLQEIKEKHKNDPQKQQEAMLALYKEHGFNPFAGCLPMLVPFPVLITLFFVFQNTIAFRGAEFLWLPDLSLRDPFYLLPLVLVVSMFGLQWVSAHLSGIEQNPQMKMMMYMMPVMMGAIFFMLPAGLNLYYAVTQVASIPQQVLIARERKQAQEELKKAGGPKLPAVSGAPRRKSPKSKR